MGFDIVVSGGQQTIIDAGGYHGRDYAVFCPQPVVFRCRPAATTTEDVVFSFEYDTVTVGAFGDVKRDMVVLLTTGTTIDDLKRPLWRGRITKLPTSDTLFINESSIALDPALYVSVLDTYDVTQRLRSLDLIDGHLVFEKAAPAIKGLASTYFKIPTVGEAQFSFAPEGQAMEQNATIDDDTAWTWDIPGAVYDVGDATTREITVTLPEGQVWATVTCEDSNGIIGRFIFEIYVLDPDDSSLIPLGADGADLSNNWSDGVNASIEYFEGITDILDRTRVSIVTFETWRTGDAEFPNVSFVGYLRQNDDETRADENYSALQSRRYTIAGFAALAGEVKLSSLAINDTATPTAWDDIAFPNAARVIEHFRTRYSTIGQLTGIDYGDLNSLDWYAGDIDSESSFLLDSCNQIADEINARLIHAPDGQIILRRNLCILDDTDRDAADTAATIPAARIQKISVKRPHMPELAQLVVGFRSYRTLDASSVGFIGTAPATAYDEGADFEELPAQLLKSNATDAEAEAEASQRTGHLYAALNTTIEISVELDGSYRFMQPSQHQWWCFDIAGSLMVDGIALTSATRLLLKSMSHQFNPERATRTVTATFQIETRGGLAMILVTRARSEVSTAMPPRPPMSAYGGALPPAGSLYTTSQTPTRRSPYTGTNFPGMPYSPAQSDAAGRNMPTLGCRVQNPPINFRNPADVNTPFTLVNGVDYLIFVKGSAKIASGAFHHHTNFILGDDGYVPYPGGGGLDAGVYTPGSGWGPAVAQPGRGHFVVLFPAPTFIGTVRIGRDAVLTGDVKQIGVGNWDGATISGSVNHVQTALLTDFILNTMMDGLAIQIVQSANAVTPAINGFTVSATVDGIGTNPFTGDPGVELGGDAFYQWVIGAEDEPELYPANRGLRLNSTAVAVPPAFNPNHEYGIAYEGEGNPLPLKFEDDDHTDNQNAILYVKICGTSAGT